MARIHYWQYILDTKGRPVNDANIRVYEEGTLNEANIFLHPERGTFSTSSAENLQTDEQGFFQFWIGDRWEVEGGYTEHTGFKVAWNGTDQDGNSVSEEIDHLYIFAAVEPIDITNTNEDFNKVISNRLGYKWGEHVNSIVPSASPHDLEQVVFFDLDEKFNKVVSNKLGYQMYGYQMYEMATNASSIAIDVSAARMYNITIKTTEWTASGGQYYKDIKHSFNNYYVLPVLEDIDRDKQIIPKRIESRSTAGIDPDWTRVWLNSVPTSWISVTLFG
jgi:hypothetical protein